MNGKNIFIKFPHERSFLIISAGIIIALLLLNNLLPRRTPPVYRPKLTSLPSTGLSQNSGVEQAAPSPTLEFQAVTQVLAVQAKNCTYTEEYWGANPEAWLTDNIVIGQFSFTKPEGLTLLNTATEDTSTLLQKQFLAAILNILMGADSSPIEAALSEAGYWINDHPPEVEMPESDRNKGVLLVQRLSDYNHGLLGPVLCPDQPPTSTPTPTRTQTSTPTLALRSYSSPTARASQTLDPDEQGAPTQGVTDIPTGTAAPIQPPTATQLPAVTKPPLSTPTSAPTNPPIEVTSPPPSPEPTIPPPPEPTSPPEDTSPPPSQVPPSPVPPPTEAPSPPPIEEPSGTEAPDILDILPTLGLPLP